VIHKDVEKCISGHLPRKQELKAKHEHTPSTSSCTLPQLDQRVLAGYAPTLVGRDSRGGSLDESYSSSQGNSNNETEMCCFHLHYYTGFIKTFSTANDSDSSE
jgi:hypothetical protein